MLIEALAELEEVQAQVWDGRFHVSDISYASPRRLLYIARNVPVRRPYRPVLREGLLHEDDIIARLRANGCNVTLRNIELKDDNWPIVGHIDGLVQVNGLWYPLETKSVNFRWFQDLKKKYCQEAFPEYWNQIQLYLSFGSSLQKAADGPLTDTAFLIAKNRDTGQLFEQMIPYDPSVQEHLLHDIVAPALHAYEHGLDYSAVECGCQAVPRIQKYCPYRFFCEEGKVENLEPVEDVRLKECAGMWTEAKALEERAEELKGQAKISFEQHLRVNDLNKFLVEGYTVQMIQTTRESANIKLLREKLGREEAQKFIKSSQTEYVRVS